MNNLIKYFCITLLVFAYSCEPINIPESKKLSHSLLFNLVVGQENQKFYIYRIVDSEQEYDSEIFNKEDRYFQKDANITLYSSNMDFTSFGVQDSGSFYRNSYYSNTKPLALFTNTKYNINITINDSNITGTTTTPGDFRIIYPSENKSVKLNTSKSEKEINIKWTKSKSAKGYILKVLYKFKHQGWNDTTIVEGTYKDSFVTIDTSFNYIGYLHKGTLTIDILAYDKNYHNHFIEFRQSAGINGAYGYFGSSVRKTVTTNLIE